MRDIERLALDLFQLFKRQRGLAATGAAHDDEGRGRAKHGFLRVVEGNRLVEQMDNRPLGMQIAHRLRFLFRIGGVAIDDFVLVDDRAT